MLYHNLKDPSTFMILTEAVEFSVTYPVDNSAGGDTSDDGREGAGSAKGTGGQRNSKSDRNANTIELKQVVTGVATLNPLLAHYDALHRVNPTR